MRILIHGINFAPELTGIGKYTGEMARWLAREGHEVRVVTAPPYYPDWRIGNDYSAVRYLRQAYPSGCGEMTMYRCPLWVPASPSGGKRLVHLASFAASSLPVMLAQVRWRPDLVLVIAPTLFCAPMAALVARVAGAKSWLHIQDFEVDAAFGLGMLQSTQARRWFLGAESQLLRRFDRVSTISDRMMDRLADKGVPTSRRVLFRNWTDTKAIYPLAAPSGFRDELDIADDSRVVLYAGNLGEKQGLDVLIDAARRTACDESIIWVIAGAGSARVKLEARSVDLPNVRWLPLQPMEKLNELLNLADIHVLPQRADAADLVMPSKLTGMLASGRPVVATAAEGTQVASIVSECGICVPPEDADALAKALSELADDGKRRYALGAKARHYAERHLGYEQIMRNFEFEAEALVNGAADTVEDDA
ncbi:glycosyltransferase WbuB [Salinisphaera sp. LB1]|uniref:glycosyltransferase WbuB n=1 Tax=Salinisphaera sp. LB1 TaxID=2183911 RepID=UPI000D7058E0|nr:glycosyltransferase WbuB [Salinisphaera sp. LB1]AWN17516.1 Colanic acid biosysnthesis glycosyl transferase WcaI [Salinisphaera sp. LB1]